jgi:hypothetical protein
MQEKSGRMCLNNTIGGLLNVFSRWLPVIDFMVKIAAVRWKVDVFLD